MRKLFLGLGIIGILLMVGCEKEDITLGCNCGKIANDGIDDSGNWLEIRNNCSGEKKKFYFDADIWVENHVGDSFCVTNSPEW